MSWVFCLAVGTYELNRAERETCNSNSCIHVDNALQVSMCFICEFLSCAILEQIAFPFYRWENWGEEKLSNLSKSHTTRKEHSFSNVALPTHPLLFITKLCLLLRGAITKQNPGAGILEIRDTQMCRAALRTWGSQCPFTLKALLQNPEESVDRLIEDICFISYCSSWVCSSQKSHQDFELLITYHTDLFYHSFSSPSTPDPHPKSTLWLLQLYFHSLMFLPVSENLGNDQQKLHNYWNDAIFHFRFSEQGLKYE